MEDLPYPNSTHIPNSQSLGSEITVEVTYQLWDRRARKDWSNLNSDQPRNSYNWNKGKPSLGRNLSRHWCRNAQPSDGHRSGTCSLERKRERMYEATDMSSFWWLVPFLIIFNFFVSLQNMNLITVSLFFKKSFN